MPGSGSLRQISSPSPTIRDTPALKATFDATLEIDLTNAGIFDMVSKSMSPQAMPGSPQEVNLPQWAAAPASARWWPSEH